MAVRLTVADRGGYRRLVVAKALVQVSASIEGIITGFLIEALTDSATMVAAFGAAFGVAYVLGQVPSAAFVSRVGPHRAIVLSNLIAAAALFAEAALYASGLLTAGVLIGFAAVIGFTWALSVPVGWAALLKAATGPQAGPRASSIYAGVAAALGIVGSIAGTLLLGAQAITGGLVIAGAVSFTIMALAWSLRDLRVDVAPPPKKPVQGYWRAAQLPGARYVMIMTVVLGVLAAPLAYLFPVVSTWVDHEIANYLGLLFTMYFVGAMLQILVIGRLEGLGTRVLLFASVLGVGALLLILALTRHPILTLAIVVLYGLGLGIASSMFSSTMNAMGTPETHGSLVSLNSLVFCLAGSFVGTLAWGAAADAAGLTPVLLVAGSALVLAAVVGSTRFPRQRVATAPGQDERLDLPAPT